MIDVKKISVILIVLIFAFQLSGCSSEMEAETSSSNVEYAFSLPEQTLESLDVIDTQISDVLLDIGYTINHASFIQEILNTVGIMSISVESMSGNAEDGLNAAVCYPNGYTDRDRCLFFTTEDGVLFYVGFSGEDLYDSDKGGYLKDYNDVHVPKKEVTVDVYETLRGLSENTVKENLNYPSSASFGMLDWGIGRSDDKYQVIGSVTAKNGIGAEEKMAFSVWFVSNSNGFDVGGLEINGIRIK